ncbi:MAG: DNA polymerase IV [Solirubrobacterales bacterium]
MTAEASILHADLDAFYASVEQRDDPQLRGRPVIVGDGVVLACSYEAKALGVRTAMNGPQARRTCPEAVVVPARMSAYSEASEAVYSIFHETSPLVEGLSIDEAFLDASGLEHISGSPVDVAAKLRREVLEKVGLRISVGIARTKFLAKIASGESKPDGLLVIEPEEEIAFLHPLPIERVWGVGRVTSEKLRSMGIRTVGEIAACDEKRLVAALGSSAGVRLIDLANNRDPRPVKPREPRQSIGAQSAFPRSSKSMREIDALAAGLVDRTTHRLRAAGKVCGTVSISLRFDDMKKVSRSHTLSAATNQTDHVLKAVRTLLADAGTMIEQRGITLLGVSLEKLDSDDAVQLGLDLDGSGGDGNLDAAIDELRDRFGSEAITRASLAEGGTGVSVPILPD